MALPIAVQMYTLRDLTRTDLPGNLKAVAELGYQGVELAGLCGHSPSEVAAMAADLGLTICGNHDGSVLADPSPAIDVAKGLGVELVVCPYLGDEYRTPEGYKQAAEMLNVSGAKLSAAGLQLCYHNHAFEFEKLADGSRGFDVFIARCDTKLVKFEVDLGWVHVGGDDPAAFCEALSGRVPLLHVKDMAKSDPVVMAEVGTGAVDFAPVLAKAAEWGAQWLIVEQDRDWVDDDPMKSVTVSLANLKKMMPQ